MSTSRRRLSRRAFLRGAGRWTLAAAAGSALGRPAAGQDAPQGAVGGASSRVVDVNCDFVIYGMLVRDRLLREILDSAVMNLAEAETLESAWGRYVQPGERILIKFPRQEGPHRLRTAQPVLQAMVESLEAVGHDRARIRAVECPFSQVVEGLDPAPIGWSERTIDVLGQPQQLRRYLDDVDAIINVPLACDHSLVGVNGAMVNVSLPLIRTPGRILERAHEAIVDICANPAVADRVRLTVVNALRVIYDGGPIVDPDNTGYMFGLWASTDMVAVDRLMQHRLERMRRERGLMEFSRAGRGPQFLSLAARAQLGNNDLRWIRHEITQL